MSYFKEIWFGRRAMLGKRPIYDTWLAQFPPKDATKDQVLTWINAWGGIPTIPAVIDRVGHMLLDGVQIRALTKSQMVYQLRCGGVPKDIAEDLAGDIEKAKTLEINKYLVSCSLPPSSYRKVDWN